MAAHKVSLLIIAMLAMQCIAEDIKEYEALRFQRIANEIEQILTEYVEKVIEKEEDKLEEEKNEEKKEEKKEEEPKPALRSKTTGFIENLKRRQTERTIKKFGMAMTGKRIANNVEQGRTLVLSLLDDFNDDVKQQVSMAIPQTKEALERSVKDSNKMESTLSYLANSIFDLMIKGEYEECKTTANVFSMSVKMAAISFTTAFKYSPKNTPAKLRTAATFPLQNVA